ncbi:MAG: hypothetical protein ACKPKO_39395, partial [Candidatus Fonsibacter sp.]
MFDITDGSTALGAIRRHSARPEELERDHPAMEVLNDDEFIGNDPDDGDAWARRANCKLRRYGSGFLRAMVDGWWYVWRSRRGVTDPVLEA